MMKRAYKKIVIVICTLVFLFGSMFEPFTCAGFRPVRSFVVHAEEDPGTTTATNTGIAALIAILMASGIRFVGDYETVVQPAITKLWDDFTSYAGNQLSLAQLGAGIAISQGYMRVNSSVNNAVAGFQSWYQNTFNVPNTGNVSINIPGTSVYTSIPSNTCTQIISTDYGNNRYYYSRFSDNVRAAVFYRTNGNGYLVAMSPQSFMVSSTNTSISDWTGCPVPNTSSTAYYYYQYISQTYTNFGILIAGNYAHTYSNIGLIDITNDNRSDIRQIAFDYLYGDYSGAPDTYLQGETYELKDGFQLDNDQAKLLDIAGLAALAAALGLALDNVTDLVNDIPLIYGYPWAQDFPDVYPNTPADTIPWVDTPTSVIPADVPEYVPTTPSDTDSYKVLGLERVFPFSIPFDLYYLVQAFSASPETPHFTIGMYNPASRRMETQEINLQQFETYAQIFRVFVTAMFILALILITRKLIRS